MPRTACMIRQWVAVAGLLVAAGCATTAPPAGTSEDVILEAPEAQVRAAFVRVLAEGGYDVTQGAQDDSEIRTGYREEISNYNWLYRTQFGVNRSRVIVTLTQESETATRVTVRMMYEGKDGEWMPLAGSWVPYDAALPQNASNTIRLVKNELGLL
ncbi:MAG: hypothetical protein A3K11_02570 [Nitrospirae bacterium RIFCSPLOWO2_12_FULL_63_8]|nr:MAG: hypothetical protein A3K11_02570 [Nitrospirae bacterium RIFCSPLOWO2_12_FULL_63_8]